MDAHQGICYLDSRPSQPLLLEEKLRRFLQNFGRLTHFEVLRRSPRWELLIEFDALESLELAAETLRQSRSELGIITVLGLPNGTPKSQGCTDQASATVSKHLGSGPKTPAEHPFDVSANSSGRSYRNEARGSPGSSAERLPRSRGGSEQDPKRLHFCPAPLGRPKLSNGLASPPVNEPGNFFRTLQEFPTTETPPPEPLPGRFHYLFLKNLNLAGCKLSCVLNLLGAFGNVSNYVIDKKNESGAFAFTGEEGVDVFVSCMQGQLFFGAHLICSKIASEVDLAAITEADNERYIVGAENKKNHRYQQNLVIKFNPPSCLLHVTNVAEFIDQQRLFQLFGKYHQTVRIMKLRQRSATASEMFLAEFDQPHKAIEILSLFHNTNVADRSIKISFSHTKVDAHVARTQNI